MARVMHSRDNPRTPMPNLIELVVTPPAGAGARVLDTLPAIRHAFARRVVPVVNAAADEYWFRRFDVRRQHDWPAAVFRTAGPHARFQLCADPVHLGINGDAVTLDATASADLAPEDAQSLIANLNAHFAADDMRVSLVTSGEWLLETPRPIAATTTSLPRVHGRSIETHLPQGRDARLLKRVGNEAQMVLHEAAVNLAREARGQLPINGLWLWGGGEGCAVAATNPAMNLYSDAAHVRGMAMAAGAQVQRLPEGADAMRLDAAVAARTIDLDARTNDPQTFPAWLDQTWLHPLEEIAARSALDCHLTLVLPQAAITARLFERDLLRALRRGGLVARLERAGHAPLEQ